MRAYREQHPNQGVNILSLMEFQDLGNNRSPQVLYIVGTIDTTANTVMIDRVYVGNIEQSFLVDNQGALVWVGNVDPTAQIPVALTGFTNAAVALANLV